jgi:hypothetical protein
MPACKRLSVFGDYKLSFATNDTELKGGGSLDTDVWTNHFIFAPSYRFGGAWRARPCLLGLQASPIEFTGRANAHIGIGESG